MVQNPYESPNAADVLARDAAPSRWHLIFFTINFVAAMTWVIMCVSVIVEVSIGGGSPFAFAGAILFAISSQSDAAGSIDPRCQRMLDKVRCTCALQTGGYISGGRWYSGGPWGTVRGGEGSQEAYYACLRARGSPAKRD